MKELTVFFMVIFLIGILFFFGCSTGLDNGSTDASMPNSPTNLEDEILAANDAFPPGYVPYSGPTKADLHPVDLSGGTRAPASKTINVPRKVQETSYWCGPASIQMVQYYFNMPATQTRIAEYCGTSPNGGTYVYKIVEWLNDSPMTGYASLPSWWVWEYVTVTSATDFKNKITSSVGNYNAPQIWHLKTYPSSTYHLPGYTGNYGHYITGSGYDSTRVLEDDPWYGSGGGSNIWVNATTMYYCIKANASLIIY